MNRDEYLALTLDRLGSLLSDPGLDNQRSQLRAKQLLMRFSASGGDVPTFTYRPEQLSRNAVFAFEAALRLLEENRDISILAEGLRLAAEIFERLSGLNEGPGKDISNLLAAGLYELAGYQANASCIARLLDVPVTPEPLNAEHLLLVRWLSLALQRRFVLLSTETARHLATLAGTQRAFLEQIEQRDLHPDALIGLAEQATTAAALHGISLYALRGDVNEYTAAVASCDSLATLLLRTGQASESLVVRVLKGFMRQLARNSTWALLGPQIAGDPLWQRYAQLLARGTGGNPLETRGVVDLWRSQQIALAAGLLEDDNHGFVVRMPTGAGKTRIAEMAIMKTLTANDASKVVYVAPYRALSDEIERNLTETFADLGFRVASVLGSFEFDDVEEFLLHDTDVLITTPEKLDLLSRVQSAFFADVRLLILDEGHVIDNDERGARYELLLTRLRMVMPEDARVIFISAVLPEINAQEFAKWLCGDADAVIETTWRPARQLLGIFRWRTMGGEIEYALESPVSGRAPWIPRAITTKPYTDFTPKLRKPKEVSFPARTRPETAAELAIRFAEQGPVLVFATTTVMAESCAKAIRRGLQLRRQTEGEEVPPAFEDARNRIIGGASIPTSSAWLGEESLIVQLLSEGIAVHHAGLPEVVRRAIEDDFRSGRIAVLLATNTLAQGVNLPIKTVIVHSTSRYHKAESDEDSGMERLTSRDFWNICGRAGRATAETEGQVIFVALNEDDEEAFKYYSTEDLEPLEGRLLRILEDLATERLSQEGFARQLDSELLTLLVEELPGTEAGSRLEQVLERSLVKIQAERTNLVLEPLVSAGKSLVQSMADRIVDPAKRQVFAATGLRVTSCEELERTIRADEERVRAQLTSSATSIEDLAAMLFNALADVPQIEPRVSFQTDHLSLLLDWLNEVPIQEIVERHTESPSEAQRLHRFIGDFLAFRMPWGTSSYLRIAAHVLELTTIPDLQRFLPSMIKYGVSHPYATWPMGLGCPSRQTASRLASGFREDLGDSRTLQQFIAWFSGLSEEDFVYRFEASPLDAQTLTRRATSLTADRIEFASLLRAGFSALETSVVGLQYEARATHLLAAEPGDAVELNREYGNQYDRNAVMVLVEGSGHIGYLPRRIARLIAPELDSGLRFEAKLTSIERTGTVRAGLSLARA